MFLILRRMSLMGDALAHALLPGAALGFLLGGLSLPAMSLGGFLAGITTALVSGAIARFTSMREDASFAAAYLTALALGVLIVSLRGSAVDLMNILFGAILAVDDQAMFLVAGTTTLTLVGLAAIYRPLVVECFNPGFLAAMGVKRRALSLPVPGARRAEHGGGLPGARHPDGARPDAAAGGRGLVLGARGLVDDGDRRTHGLPVRGDRFAGLVPCRPAVGTGDRADGEPVLPGLAAVRLARLGARGCRIRFTSWLRRPARLAPVQGGSHE